MKSLTVFAVVLSLFTTASVFAEEKGGGPCKKIVEACEQAGFVKGQAKEGTGLWMDCVCPAVTGKPQPANSKKPLPTIGADLISACKAKRPNFCEGKGHDKK